MMEYTYGELIPNQIVDTFYNIIKDRMNMGMTYENYIKNVIKINGKIPTKIETLIKKYE